MIRPPRAPPEPMDVVLRPSRVPPDPTVAFYVARSRHASPDPMDCVVRPPRAPPDDKDCGLCTRFAAPPFVGRCQVNLVYAT